MTYDEKFLRGLGIAPCDIETEEQQDGQLEIPMIADADYVTMRRGDFDRMTGAFQTAQLRLIQQRDAASQRADENMIWAAGFALIACVIEWLRLTGRIG